MKTLKFIPTDQTQKQFASVLRKNVHNYFQENGISPKGNFAMVLKTIAMFSLYLLPFAAILLFPMNPWMAVPLVIIMGIGSSGIGMSVMHDAIHNSYSDKEWVNRLLGRTIYLLGSSVFTWKMQHNIFHHAYTNIEGHDEDIAGKFVMRLSEHAPLKKIHRTQHFHAFLFYSLLTLSKLVTDFKQMVDYTKAGIAAKHRVKPNVEFTKMSIAKAVYLFAFIGLPVIITGFAWWQVIIGFLIMHFTAGFILSTIFQMAHVVEGAEQVLPNEHGVIETEWAVHELLTTANFARNNLFLNWYIGGLNFQIEHHLFPKICHIHYKNISPIVEQTAREFGIQYNLQPTFTRALVSHFRRLKQLGRQPQASE